MINTIKELDLEHLLFIRELIEAYQAQFHLMSNEHSLDYDISEEIKDYIDEKISL